MIILPEEIILCAYFTVPLQEYAQPDPQPPVQKNTHAIPKHPLLCEPELHTSMQPATQVVSQLLWHIAKQEPEQPSEFCTPEQPSFEEAKSIQLPPAHPPVTDRFLSSGNPRYMFMIKNLPSLKINILFGQIVL